MKKRSPSNKTVTLIIHVLFVCLLSSCVDDSYSSKDISPQDPLKKESLDDKPVEEKEDVPKKEDTLTLKVKLSMVLDLLSPISISKANDEVPYCDTQCPNDNSCIFIAIIEDREDDIFCEIPLSKDSEGEVKIYNPHFLKNKHIEVRTFREYEYAQEESFSRLPQSKIIKVTDKDLKEGILDLIISSAEFIISPNIKELVSQNVDVTNENLSPSSSIDKIYQYVFNEIILDDPTESPTKDEEKYLRFHKKMGYLLWSDELFKQDISSLMIESDSNKLLDLSSNLASVLKNKKDKKASPSKSNCTEKSDGKCKSASKKE